MLTTTLWEEEKKEMKKVIIDQGEEIIELKEKLARQKQKMDHALKLDGQIITCRLPPRIYAIYFKRTINFILVDDDSQRYRFRILVSPRIL